jgi:hypothetical protein
LFAISAPRDPQLDTQLRSIFPIGWQGLSGTRFSQPPHRYFLGKLIKTDDRNENSVTGAGRLINHEIAAASNTLPLQN